MDAKDKVFKILGDLSGCTDITEDSSLSGDLGLDSLSMVVMLIELEEALGTELRESDMNPFDFVTVSDVVKLFEKYLGGTYE